LRRRELIGFAGTALFMWPLVARAQQQPKIARLGYLGFGIPAASAPRVVELPRFRGHPMVGAERSVHDAEEPSAIPARVSSAAC